MNLRKSILITIGTYIFIAALMQRSYEDKEQKEKQKVKLKLEAFILKYCVPAFVIVASISIIILISIAVSFSLHSTIKPLLALSFICDSLAAGIALYVSFLSASRRWYIPAILIFIFGMFFKLFALL